MPTIKKLYIASGVSVTAPTDLTSESSTVHVAEYANDAAFVSANGTASAGDIYINSTTKAVRFYTGAAWRSVLVASNAADPTKAFVIDTDGATTGTTVTLDFNQTANRTYVFPDTAGIVVINTGTTTDPIIFSGATGNVDIGNASGTVRIVGNFEVQGTQTILNTQTVEVEDQNIIVNNGGSDVTAQGAGITVERTGTNGSIAYDSALSTRWKIGDLGSEVEVVDRTTAQTVTNKTISGSANTITNVSLTAGVSGVLPTANGGTGQNSSATFPTSGAVAVVPSSGVVKSNGTVLSSSNVDLTTEVTGTLPLGSGGTGQTTANAALNALLPSQTANTNKFLKTDGTNTLWDSAGGGGSGAGEINAILNSSAADNTTGWTNGTSHTLTRLTSGSPLAPVVTTALSVAATTTASESSTSGEYYTFTMPDGLKSKKLKVEFYYITEASQTWAVSVYKSTTRIPLSTDSSGVTTLPAGSTGKFTAYFDADTSSSYSVNVTRTAGTGTATLVYTSVIVGPGIQPQGALTTEWKSYTPTGSWSTNTTYTGLWRRVGSQIQLKIGIALSGAPTGSLNMTSVQVLNGLGVTYLPSQSAATNASKTPSGIWNATDTGTADYFGQMFPSDSTAANPSFAPLLAGTGAAIAVNATSPFAWNNTDKIGIELSFAIAEWAGSGVLNTAQNDIEYASNSDVTDADTTASGFVNSPEGTPFGPYTTATRTKRVRFPTPVQAGDELTLEVFRSSKWIPVENSEFKSVNNTTGIDMKPAAGTTDVDVLFGSAGYGNTLGGSAGAWGPLAGSQSFKWRVKKEKAGVAVGFGIANTDQAAGLYKPGLAPGLNTGATIGSGYVGQKISANLSSSYVITTTIADVTNATLPLTAGVWLIVADLSVQIGGVGTGRIELTDSANTLVGNGSKGIYSDISGVATLSANTTIVETVNISASTTYKLRALRGSLGASTVIKGQSATEGYSAFYAIRLA